MIKNDIKKIEKSNYKKTPSSQRVLKTIWFWLIIPLTISGYGLGCSLNTSGNIFAGVLMIFGPVFLGLWLIILIILLLVGLRNKNQSLILMSKIGLLLASFPVSYTAGVILCHLQFPLVGASVTELSEVKF